MFKKKPKHVLPPTPTPTGYGSDEPAAPARRPSPRPATRTSGGGGGAAPAGNASAYYRGTAGAGDDRSMFAYGKSLERAPEAFEDFARMLGAWAREGEDDQPVDPAVAEQIRAAQQIVTQLGVDSSDWAPNFRRRESAALSRLDSPARGSRYVEEKRDVGAARREGL